MLRRLAALLAFLVSLPAAAASPPEAEALAERMLAWYLLDRRAQPYRYGAHEDEEGGTLAPWETQVGGIRHPVWVTRDNGKWRAMLQKLGGERAVAGQLVRGAARRRRGNGRRLRDRRAAEYFRRYVLP